jgi:hypothetical protein
MTRIHREREISEWQRRIYGCPIQAKFNNASNNLTCVSNVGSGDIQVLSVEKAQGTSL